LLKSTNKNKAIALYRWKNNVWGRDPGRYDLLVSEPGARPTGQLIAANVLPSQARRVYKLLEVAATMQIIPVNGILQDWLKSFEGIVDRMYD
jgi:hypothetical protein